MHSKDPIDLDGDDIQFHLPNDAHPDEAAAIMIAINAHIRSLEAAAAAETQRGGDFGGWAGEKWAFAGRLRHLRYQPKRVPDQLPRDAWTAAGRIERF